MGERIEATGEKGSYYVYTRDGAKLAIRDKTNIQFRCDQLEFMWRAADKGLWRHISGTGFKLQADKYWKILLQEAEVDKQPEASVFRRTSRMPLLAGTGDCQATKATGAISLRGVRRRRHDCGVVLRGRQAVT